MRKIEKSCSDGIITITFEHSQIREIAISAIAKPGENLSDFLRRVRGSIPGSASVITQDVFGSADTKTSFVDPNHPITWIEPLSNAGNHFLSTQIQAIEGPQLHYIKQDGRTVGSLYEDKKSRYLRLAGLGLSDPALPAPQQARNAFLEMQRYLLQNDMTFHNVLRTWFYNDRILDWYSPFNQVRTQFFIDHDIVLSEFPASTGIGAPNPFNSALSAGLLAVAAKDSAASWKTVESPMQESPSEYGSSFSRAAELASQGLRRLFISGTASISYDGKTVHEGDIDKQIDLTMQVVKAILESRGMNWDDATRALAYFKEPNFLNAWNEWNEKHRLSLPLCIAHADICRDDLLFEIELDALKAD